MISNANLCTYLWLTISRINKNQNLQRIAALQNSALRTLKDSNHSYLNPSKVFCIWSGLIFSVKPSPYPVKQNDCFFIIFLPLPVYTLFHLSYHIAIMYVLGHPLEVKDCALWLTIFETCILTFCLAHGGHVVCKIDLF